MNREKCLGFGCSVWGGLATSYHWLSSFMYMEVLKQFCGERRVKVVD